LIPLPPPLHILLKATTFRCRLCGPFFNIISCMHRADLALCPCIFPWTTWPLLLVSVQADDSRATPALHDLWAYAVFIAPKLWW
jgi:hypothetical protein